MNLEEFFVDKKITIPFKLFGKTHLFLMFTLIICLILIIKNKKAIYHLKPIIKRRITVILAIIYLLNMLILYLSSFIYHNFDFKTMLPLHLCYLSNYFYIYTILFKKYKWYKYLYFIAFLGPLPAIIFFDVPSVFESFNFYLYLISHHLFLIGGFLCFYFYPQKIYRKDVIKLFVTLNIIYIFMIIFNKVFSTNYFFSNSIPKFIIDLIPFLKYLNPTIILEIMEIIIIWLLSKFYNFQVKIMKFLKSSHFD